MTVCEEMDCCYLTWNPLLGRYVCEGHYPYPDGCPMLAESDDTGDCDMG